MNFTSGQICRVLGLSKETFRHWKSVLPPYSDRKGRSACFSPGDLLATAVIHRLTDNCAARVGKLDKLSIKIFDICNDIAWAALEGQMLVVDVKQETCRVQRNIEANDFYNIAIVCPFGPLIRQLQIDLLHSQPGNKQGNLFFPPNPISTKVRIAKVVKR